MILSAIQSLTTAFDKTSAINEHVETTGRNRHRHFGVGQNRLLLLNNYQFKLKPTFEAKLIGKMLLERCPQ